MKQSNQHLLHKGEVKLRKNQTILPTAPEKHGRWVRVNNTTKILVTDQVTDEESITRFNKRHGI